ncbi:hypothetical protein V3C99_010672 [Haemonchus contortus]|uniref:Uncharacterized protein n=1 Tax=Haemonchus contortus TaxID=6289 RepID=A0A7I4Y7F4_HAECO|nr:unnamed protein product [Haemonchus contortus]
MTSTSAEKVKRPGAFNLPSTSESNRLETKEPKVEFEPLGDGDDANLDTETSGNAPSRTKTISQPKTQSRDITRTPKTSTPAASSTKRSRTRCQKWALCTIIILAILLVITATLTIILFLHLKGIINWFPSLHHADDEEE